MENKSNNSSRLLAAGFLIVLVAVLVGGGVALYRNGAFSENSTANTNSSNSNVNQVINSGTNNINVNNIINSTIDNSVNVIDGYIDLKNNFLIKINDGWNTGIPLVDALNIVQYGSPAQLTSIQLVDQGNSVTPPVLSISTFTIDERLSAQEVANLIQDKKIADIIEGEKGACQQKTTVSIVGLSTYSYISDTTDFRKCAETVTEPSKMMTVVVKNTGNPHTLIASFVASTKDEYEKYIGDATQMIKSIKYSS
ncbi:MAG: hypothetical protein WCT27_01820 [Patescibacteria group bacterium]|jgi:hypothetical protein